MSPNQNRELAAAIKEEGWLRVKYFPLYCSDRDGSETESRKFHHCDTGENFKVCPTTYLLRCDYI